MANLARAPKKRVVSFSCDPQVWFGFQTLVEMNYGPSKASSHVEHLVKVEHARLYGRADEYVNGVIVNLRDIANNTKDPVAQEDLRKLVEGLAVWASENKELTNTVTDVELNYLDLEKRYNALTKIFDRLLKILQSHECLGDLQRLATDYGLELSNFSNYRTIIAKLLIESDKPDWEYKQSDLLTFIQALEKGKAIRDLGKRIEKIQQKLYK